LPLDVGAAVPAGARRLRSRPRGAEQPPLQLALDVWQEDPPGNAIAPPQGKSAPSSPAVNDALPEDEEPRTEVEPPGLDADPFADIPGLGPSPPGGGEFALLPTSLRSRLDLREFSRFLASLPTVVRDWEGAPEVEEGGIRLGDADGGAWVYPEPRRVRLVTDGAADSRVAEDMVALCRWLEARAGMRLYPAGANEAASPDRSLDPWDTFLGN
jgi:hypothetical protein